MPPTREKTLNNLTPGSHYEYQLRTQCPTGWTGWTSSHTFTTPSTTSGTVDPTSNEEITSTSIIIYPNPARDYVQLNLGNQSLTAVHLYNLQGKLVKSFGRTESNNSALDISDMKTGLYIVRFQLDNGDVQSEKLTVIK